MRRFAIAAAVVASIALYGGAVEAAGRNPCAANPCATSDRPDPSGIRRPAGTHLAKGDRAELLKEGEKLWSDPSLSTNGFTCDTCHNNHATFSAGFAKPYPHKVGMVKERLGIAGEIHLDEMVQFCLVMPLTSKTLPWDSRELAALTAYTAEMQRTFKPAAE